MNSKTGKNKRSSRKWLRWTGITLATLILVPLFLFTLGWFNRDLLIDELQDWYGQNNNGKLEIGEVNANFLGGFPNVGFTIEEIYQTSFDTILDKSSTISIKKVQVSVSAKDIMKGDIKFKNITINDAHILTEVITKKSLEDYIHLKKRKQASPTNSLEFPTWLDTERTNFILRDVIFVVKDTMLNKHFDLEIQEAIGRLRTRNKEIIGSLDFRIKANALGFNAKKGSFINGAIVYGNPEFVLNAVKNRVEIPEFTLEVGSQKFQTKASFNFEGINSYTLSLKNEATDFQQLQALLPKNIVSSISKYKFLEPIATDLILKGNFQYADVPIIDANFSTQGNTLQIGDHVPMTAVNLNGYLTNTLGKDAIAEIPTPGKKDIKIYFKDITAKVDDAEISAVNSYFQSSDKYNNYVNARIKISGSNKALSRILQTDNFNFIGGSFNLDADINGDIPSDYEVFNYASGRFVLNDTRVVLKKNNLQLPVEIADLRLRDKNSTLEQLIINLPNGEALSFSGQISNISSLLSSDPEVAASANVILDSEDLNINDLIATAMEFIPDANRPANELNTLHETLEAIYKKFQPTFTLNLSTVQYNNDIFHNLTGKVHLENAETITLDTLQFNYNNAVTDLRGTVKIPESQTTSQEPIFLNVEANSSGALNVFQDLFNIQLVAISDGNFNFHGTVTGNVQKIEQLLNNASGDLQITNSKFYYPKADINIELDSLYVAVQNSNIQVQKFVVEVEDHNPFALQSHIEDFPSFLLDEVDKKGKISIGMDAAFINLDNWMETIASIESDTNKKQLKNRDLAAIFADIYRFDPNFSIKLDSLKYKNLVSKDVAAKVYFENDSLLKLDDLSVHFKNSKATIKGQLAAKSIDHLDNQQNPFNFDFAIEAKGKSKDLNDLLKTVNFTLGSGDFKFRGGYNGEAGDLKILNTNAEGELWLSSTKVNIEGADIRVPVDSLHLRITNNLATLERLDVNLPGKSSIDITGQIDNFSNFINNDQAIDSHNSTFLIKSPYLDNRDIEKFIGNTNKEKVSTNKQKIRIKNLKQIIQNINYSYFPSATIIIDSLIYEELPVSDFNSEIGFTDSGAIKISNTQLEYYGGSVALMLEAGVASPENLPVNINMKIEDINLEQLVKDLDYFNNEDLKNAERISGHLDLDLRLRGVFSSDGSIKMESLNGIMQVGLKELAIYNFKPVLEGVVMMKQDRFKKLQFRPLDLEFEVKNGMIRIPRTQIQSSALQVFVEGELKIGEYYNIWLSLPWSNLLGKNEGIELPEKVSFKESGAKFYIQIVQDKKSTKPRKQKLKKKFRLGNGKLEKDEQD